MMHSHIFAQGSEKLRNDTIEKELAKLQVVPTDTIVLVTEEEKERIGIAQVREFTRRMILGPTASPYMAGVIYAGELLTVEAQNALLKIIEEPPSRAIFIIGTPTVGALLPTILSRCQITVLSEAEKNENTHDIDPVQVESLLSASPSVVISTIGAVAIDRATAKRFTNSVISQLRLLLISEITDKKNAGRIRTITRTLYALESAKKELSVNVTPKLALEYAFLCGR